jgi:hypothetical protein
MLSSFGKIFVGQNKLGGFYPGEFDRRRPKMGSFEIVWKFLQEELVPGTIVKNWTVLKNDLGDEMTIVAVSKKSIDVDAPKAKAIQSPNREEFEAVWNVWEDYKMGKVLRHELRDITRYSKYIISILHWYDLNAFRP